MFLFFSFKLTIYNLHFQKSFSAPVSTNKRDHVDDGAVIPPTAPPTNSLPPSENLKLQGRSGGDGDSLLPLSQLKAVDECPTASLSSLSSRTSGKKASSPVKKSRKKSAARTEARRAYQRRRNQRRNEDAKRYRQLEERVARIEEQSS